MDGSLVALGFLVGICATLNGVGVFTQAWIVDTVTERGYSISASIGIVPYYQDDPGWLKAGSVLICTSFCFFIPLSIWYIVNLIAINRFGYTPRVRRLFYSIAFAAIMVIGFTVVAVILVGANIATYSDGAEKFSLGYSAWLCVSSAILSLGIVGLSIHLARKSCCDC
ncbi:hypothetical protein L5515_009334 [Caenorhabditis briggsae]|uniref:Uncharacterized protein n=1 Tax=Caenorhabditis briggsae TaxID=6238 RepID=A0AAE9F3U1_CAEBR|nr:hypothetical protein L5515_009334 [Caenorhabditis briggsae]